MVDSRRKNRHSGPGDETNFRGYGHCLEYPEFFPTDRFNVGRSIPARTQTDAIQVQPRWFGQDLSEVPDSGIGRTQDSRTGVGWCEQNTFQPPIPQPIRRKRRAGDRVVTGADVERNVRREGPCGVPHTSEPFSVRKDKIVSPLGVMCRRPGRGGLLMMCIQRWPSPGGHLKTSISRRHGLREWNWLTR